LALGPKKSKQRVDQAFAETLAAEGLAFLADDETRLVRFMSESGMDPGALSANIGTNDTLLAVIEHICADESLLLVFAASRSIQPETVMQCAVVLQGRPHERSM
jgi:Protein of unknown function (DUF3572)